MRLFELEDRAVSVDGDKASVFDNGAWRSAPSLARKAAVHGMELSPADFARVFPTASKRLPDSKRS